MGVCVHVCVCVCVIVRAIVRAFVRTHLCACVCVCLHSQGLLNVATQVHPLPMALSGLGEVASRLLRWPVKKVLGWQLRHDRPLDGWELSPA